MSTKFIDLKVGDTFVWDGASYIKRNNNSARSKDGKRSVFTPETEVDTEWEKIFWNKEAGRSRHAVKEGSMFGVKEAAVEFLNTVLPDDHYASEEEHREEIVAAAENLETVAGPNDQLETNVFDLKDSWEEGDDEAAKEDLDWLIEYCMNKLDPKGGDSTGRETSDSAIEKFLMALPPYDGIEEAVNILLSENKLTPEQHKKFNRLLNQLSPENVSCDGELPAREVRRRVRELRRQWDDLEKEVGHSVSEEDVYSSRPVSTEEVSEDFGEHGYNADKIRLAKKVLAAKHAVSEEDQKEARDYLKTMGYSDEQIKKFEG